MHLAVNLRYHVREPVASALDTPHQRRDSGLAGLARSEREVSGVCTSLRGAPPSKDSSQVPRGLQGLLLITPEPYGFGGCQGSGSPVTQRVLPHTGPESFRGCALRSGKHLAIGAPTCLEG